MSFLFKGLRSIDSKGLSSPKDFLFIKGILTEEFDSELASKAKTIDASGWMLSEGWVD
jgi:dihydroorotase